MGHLDILRYFQKANRRAGIDVKYSGGFNPHQIMSFSAPLGLGLTSEGEYMDIEVNSTEDSVTMVKKLNDEMAEGMEILSWRKLPDNSKSAMAIVEAADYLVYFKEGYEPKNQETWIKTFQKFCNKDAICVEKQTKKKMVDIDIRPMMFSMEVSVEDLSNNHNLVNIAEQTEQIAIRMKLAAGSMENLKPELVLEAFCKFAQIEYNPLAYQIHRVELYANRGGAEEEINIFSNLISLEDMGEDIE